MFRSLDLPNSVPGKLFIHSMPGIRESLWECISEMQSNRIAAIVSLAPIDEIRGKSPEYADAITNDGIPNIIIEPVIDYHVPTDPKPVIKLAKRIAARLRNGENFLVHCGAGVGRTGMFSAIVLSFLGLSYEEAISYVTDAGSCPETQAQHELVKTVFAEEEQRY